MDLLIAPNTTGHPRTAEVFVGGQPVAVTQGGGPPCTLTTPDLVRVVSSSSAREGFALNYTAGCRWQAASNVPWITVGTGLGGPTSWVVPSEVQAHTGRTARQGTITITSSGETATAVHTVLQAAATPCKVSVTGSADRIPAAGGTVTVQLVSEPADCAAWNADARDSWAAVLQWVST